MPSGVVVLADGLMGLVAEESGVSVREALDQLELVGDLAALVGDGLLGAACQMSAVCMVGFGGLEAAYFSSSSWLAPSLRVT